MDCSLPGFSIHGILQARILEWVIFPAPGDLPNPGIKPGSLALEEDALTSEPPGKQTTNKTKMKTQSSADRITTSLSLAYQRKNKQTIFFFLSTNLTLIENYTNHWTNLRRKNKQTNKKTKDESIQP